MINKSKKQEMKKAFCGFLLVGVFFVLTVSLTNAFGVVMTYSRNNPLIVAPGETKEFQLIPNSMESEGDLKLKVSITKGAEIASLVNPNPIYELPAGGQVPVGIKVRVPESASEGSEYIISVEFADVGGVKEGGTVSFRGSSEVSVRVLVQKPVKAEEEVKGPEKVEVARGNYFWFVVVILLVVAIAVVAYLMLKRSEQVIKKK